MSHITDDNSVAQPAMALQSVVDNIERFFVAQIDRMEQYVADIAYQNDCCEADDVGSLGNQFDMTKSDWQREYESRRVELEEDCQRLAEAWERVENEQRQMLAARSIQQTVGSSPSVVAGDSPSDLKNKTPTSLTPVSGARKSAAPRDPASLTFKQLQKQIRSHNRRRK